VVGNITDALILGLAMIGIMLAFAVLALQIIVALLEFKIVTLGGFVLLPFGIWSKSAFLAERPLGYVVSSGLKVLALAIVVSGARTIFDQLQPSANPDIYEALSILVAALLLAMLAIFIPNLASALVTGGPALGAGAAVTGALAVGGATVAAGAGLAAVAGAGAKGAGPARAAAGAGAGRPPTTGPKPTPTPTPPKTTPPTAGGRGAVSTAPVPSNDNRTPRGAGRAVGEPALAQLHDLRLGLDLVETQPARCPAVFERQGPQRIQQARPGRRRQAAQRHHLEPFAAQARGNPADQIVVGQPGIEEHRRFRCPHRI